jgi:hypothetical protein
MPVFHFTLHAYRSWNTDHPRGYVQRGEWGIKPTNIPLANARDDLARFDEVHFDLADAEFLVKESHDVVRRRGLTLYGVTVIDTHVHLIAGWQGKKDEENVQGRLKNGFSFVLARRHDTKGRPYFSRGGVPERVRSKRHLKYLLEEYLPDHHGPIWCAEFENL